MTERLRLGITQEMVDQTEKNLLATTDVESADGMVSYARAVNKRIGVEQPLLLAYLRDTPRNFSITNFYILAYAVALTYEMVPDEIRRKQLEPNHIEAMHQSLIEHVEKSDQPGTYLDIHWLTDKLKDDSPPYIEWLGTVVSGIEDMDDKQDFVLGSTIVVAAFYTRSDAEILAETIDSFGNPQ